MVHHKHTISVVSILHCRIFLCVAHLVFILIIYFLLWTVCPLWWSSEAFLHVPCHLCLDGGQRYPLVGQGELRWDCRKGFKNCLLASPHWGTLQAVFRTPPPVFLIPLQNWQWGQVAGTEVERGFTMWDSQEWQVGLEPVKKIFLVAGLTHWNSFLKKIPLVSFYCCLSFGWTLLFCLAIPPGTLLLALLPGCVCELLEGYILYTHAHMIFFQCLNVLMPDAPL